MRSEHTRKARTDRYAPDAVGIAALASCCVAVAGVAAGCDGPTPPEPLEDLRTRFGLQTLEKPPYPDDNGLNPARVALGRLLFFDPILGGEMDVACGTCHHPSFAFADGRQFGAGVSGVGLGPDRQISVSRITGQPIPLEPRNSPTVLNAAFNGDEAGLTSALGLQFWDGRVAGLEAQAKAPIASRTEMAGDAYPAEVALDSVVARLAAIPAYVALFREAFPGKAPALPPEQVITGDTYGRAVGAYERELITVNSAYDRYVRGDDGALSTTERQGLVLFFTKAKCSTCHSGPMFSDFQFHVLGVPQEGPGAAVIPGDDTGREEHTGDPADRHAFRTPTLRNVDLTAPYMHDGVFETLERVVRFYNDGVRPRHPGVDEAAIDPRVTEPLGLTAAERGALVAFLRALTDPGTGLDPELLTVPAAVPSGLTPVFGVN